ncbi:hypothetical protein BT67DRAFT_284570 [Trichocladium antarcticum]|uniref:Prion-inhibition and propagation HeLo domain-containing protein n=1 Tax=Trichocladium antarcticum TaxID=1450529 RepID=A0AAN6UKU7_9PEZI|nr:hypothetical protein BT67DRAFT_284570 [Trichocladium antarcticum]
MEIAAGVISLTWDVFDSTVRIFKFITALVDMPRECEMYRLQLVMEYNRVLAWGKAVGLVDVPQGSTLAVTLGTDSIELVAIVARIQWLLSEFRELNSRYSNEVFPTSRGGAQGTVDDQPTDMDLLKGVSSLAISYEAEKKERTHRRGTNHLRGFFGKTKEVITHPARVRWVAIDKEAFGALLTDIHALTERLHELMQSYRERRIGDITAKTYREMILARNDIEELKDMFDAVTSLISTSANTRKDHLAGHHNAKTLQDLIQLKKISRISETILSHLQNKTTATPSIPDLLSSLGVTVPKYTDATLSASFEWNEPANPSDPNFLLRPRGILATALEGEIPVWIEWKTLGDFAPGSPRDKESALRTVALAQMLHLPKPATLCAPDCVGYFDDREVSGAERYGWVFKMPEGSDYDTRVVSLHAMLGRGRWKPSLGERVRMARRLCEGVLDLHAVNWLHKGIFSENVVFHCHGDAEGDGGGVEGVGYDPEKPLLSGFEFSRPDGTHTTARDADVVWDLYRWPAIQRERPTDRNSRKTYDLYSLGLVLLEVAHWERLDRVMHLGVGRKGGLGDGKVPNVPLEESRSVRGWLLGIMGGAPFEAAGKPNPVKELRNLVGDRYWKAVERCLWAHGEQGFGVEELAEQSNDSSVGILLQEAFTEHVVEELRSVQI